MPKLKNARQRKLRRQRRERWQARNSLRQGIEKIQRDCERITETFLNCERTLPELATAIAETFPDDREAQTEFSKSADQFRQSSANIRAILAGCFEKLSNEATAAIEAEE
jgi:septal ring factor EnvC (AmiA/AmiB activator)